MISAGHRFAALWVAVSLPGRPSAGTPQRLARHSIAFPENLALNDWLVSGPAMSTGSALILNPGNVDEVSMAWSRFPIPSNDFEVKVELEASVQDDDMGSFLEYDGLAIWYVHESSAEASRIDMRNQKRGRKKKRGKGFDLFGFKGLYDGLGIFLFFDAGSPMMTAVEGDGKQPVLREDVLGSPGGIGLYNAFHGDKPTGEITIQIRVDPHGARIEVPGYGDIQVPMEIKAGGHLGFTALSARWDWEGEASASKVALKSLEVLSHQAAQEDTDAASEADVPEMKDADATSEDSGPITEVDTQETEGDDRTDEYPDAAYEDANAETEEAEDEDTNAENTEDEGAEAEVEDTEETAAEDDHVDPHEGDEVLEEDEEVEAHELLRGSKIAGEKPGSGGAPAPAQLRADAAALRASIGQLTEEIKELHTGVQAHEALKISIDGRTEL